MGNMGEKRQKGRDRTRTEIRSVRYVVRHRKRSHSGRFFWRWRKGRSYGGVPRSVRPSQINITHTCKYRPNREAIAAAATEGCIYIHKANGGMSEGEPTTMSGKIKLIAIVYVCPMEWNEFTLLHLLPTLLTLSEWRPTLNIWSFVPSCPVVVMTIPQMNFPKINATKEGGGAADDAHRFRHE